ncbi:Hydroxyethylthiazole kinase family domain containing protein [Elaphomyces granulatus]
MFANLSLYLVTDPTPEILKGRDFCTVVEEALKGVLIETASKLHAITKTHGVPLIINDRVDVAIAVGAEGVHLGQDDMTIDTARKLLPDNAIIGISVSSVDEARKAVDQGADYLGIGTVFPTPTKKDTKSIIGTAGTKEILEAVGEMSRAVGSVAIGGINLGNVQRVIFQSQAISKGLDGVAVVSAIMAADDPREVATEFNKLISILPPFAVIPAPPRPNEVSALLNDVPLVVRKMVKEHPLVHNMINFVVANFAANVALAIGASPIMSPYGDEAPDLALNGGALLINMGSLTSESVSHYLKATRAYNEGGNPVVYDPVGAAATQVRRAAVKQLMADGYFDLIKGNEGEIREVFGNSAGRQRGVDSGPSTLNNREKATLTRDLARRERNIVLLTGGVDYLSDGNRVIAIGNGHSFLGQVTGTGCALGTVSGCFLAAHRSDKLLAVLSGLLLYEIASENAAAKDYVRGPGSFVPAFIDELCVIREAVLKGDDSWFSGRAKIQQITL